MWWHRLTRIDVPRSGQGKTDEQVVVDAGCHRVARPRPELSVAQRAHYTARRKEVWEALHPEPSVDYGREDGGEEEIQVGQVVPPEIGYKKPPPQTKGFAAATAEVTGENVRQIQRNLARAEAIGDDLLRLKGTCLDKGVELDALAKLPGQFRDGDETQRAHQLKRYSRGVSVEGAMQAR